MAVGDHERARAPNFDGGGDVAAPDVDQDPNSPDLAWDQLTAFVTKGRGKASDVPFLCAKLDDQHKQMAGDLMPKIAARASGEIILACAPILRQPVYFAIRDAQKAKPPASGAAIRAYLRDRTAGELASLDADVKLFAEIKKLLPGPLASTFPALADVPSEIHASKLWIEWYLASTDPAIAAVRLASNGSSDLAATLDALDKWAWLDHVHIASVMMVGDGLGSLRDATKNAAAKAKLDGMLANVLTDIDARNADAEAAKPELDAQLDDKKTPDATLIETAARVRTLPHDKAIAHMKGRPVATVIELIHATHPDPETSFALLFGAKGTTAEHVRDVAHALWTDELARALKKDRLRKQVRTHLGTKVPILDLFSYKDGAHEIVLHDEALRKWAYEDGDPRTKLWLAAGGESQYVREGCQLVGDDKGFAWVHKLPADADAMALRRFAVNCTDTKATAFVREHLLHDQQWFADEDDNTVDPVAASAYGRNDKLRVEIATGAVKPDPQEILARLSDMQPVERHALLDDAAEMKELMRAVADHDRLRAVTLLAPTVLQLFNLKLDYQPELIDYIAMRPSAEQCAAAASSAATTAARKLVGSLSPLLALPAMTEPSLLAKALDQNSYLLPWLIETTEASWALACLAREPVRAVAANQMTNQAHLFDKLPAYKHLFPEGKRGFDAIAARAAKDDDEDVRDAAATDAEAYKSGTASLDQDAADRGKQVADAGAAAHLWDGIDNLAAAHGDKTSMLALIHRAPAAEQVELLDGTHTTTVEALRKRIHLGPQHVFPALTVERMLALTDAAAWLFDTEAPFMVLGLVANKPAALKQLGAFLDAKTSASVKWRMAMPRGPNLVATERQTLDALCAYVTEVDVLRDLFRIRFDTVIDDSFVVPETKKVWSVLARLPPSQVNQHMIQHFRHADTGPSAAGYWDGKDIVIDKDPKKNEGDDTSYEHSPPLPAAEIKKVYGLDDAAWNAAIAKDGWIEPVGDKFHVKPVKLEQYTSTVLHEVGHSVDEILGKHTELVYGAAGWRVRGVDEFEDWANEMGGLDGVTGTARTRVIDAWQQALRANTSVTQIVDSDHPARSGDHKSPLMQAAREGRNFGYKEDPKPALNGRVFITNGGWLSSIPKDTYDVAPSTYSLSAPAEFFAECYVEYYKLYKGTPDTEKQKGGHLAVWIKEWFDKNVDNLRLDPKRLTGNVAEGGAPNPKQK